MKILMASSYFASHNGGLEIVAGKLFDEFAALGEEIAWMGGDVTAPPELSGRSRTVPLPIWNFVEDKTGTPFPIPAPRALFRILREVWKADVLLLHDCLYLSNIVAFLAAKWRGIPTVIIQHTRFFPNEAPLINNIIRLSTAIVTRPMLSRASQVVFIGETTRRFFEQVRFQRPPRLIFNGVDTETFRPLNTSETLDELRRGFGLPHHGRVILFVGRFVEKKGLGALRHMAAMRPDWTWAFAGWGPLDPRDWGLANVQVFSGLRGDTLAPLYRCCDLLVLPSIGEGGFPLVAREALSSGLGVLCGEETIDSDPGMRAFVSTAHVQVGKDKQTACAFLEVAERSLSPEAELTSVKEERRAVIVSGYSWPKAALQYSEILSCLAVDSQSAIQSKSTGQGLLG